MLANLTARRARVGGVAGVVLVSIWVTTAPAGASSPDTQPPEVHVGVTPTFVVGSAISTSTAWDVDPQDAYTSDILQALSWSATDDTAVCSYDLWRQYAGIEPDPLLQFSQDTSYTDTVSDYDGSFGGGVFEVEGWQVTARDCDFNATTKRVYVDPTVTQEDNQNAGHPEVGLIDYHGTWSTSSCTCYSGQHDTHTRALGARAIFTATYRRGSHVALVMSTAPNRGEAAILVDGERVSTVDTAASVGASRVVVYQRKMQPGEHTLTIRNLATPGRSRIDLDAIMTN